MSSGPVACLSQLRTVVFGTCLVRRVLPPRYLEPTDCMTCHFVVVGVAVGQAFFFSGLLLALESRRGCVIWPHFSTHLGCVCSEFISFGVKDRNLDLTRVERDVSFIFPAASRRWGVSPSQVPTM
ncbi:hypothetical protein LX36DRAFT_300772 [Colletotrichum falcatum]|nr:hypothetical protein LX36DRAFT_300772 [Colletotrichum falcatum]